MCVVFTYRGKPCVWYLLVLWGGGNVALHDRLILMINIIGSDILSRPNFWLGAT